jgi:hypothetical protein
MVIKKKGEGGGAQETGVSQTEDTDIPSGWWIDRLGRPKGCNTTYVCVDVMSKIGGESHCPTVINEDLVFFFFAWKEEAKIEQGGEGRDD